MSDATASDRSAIASVPIDQLPSGDVLVRVHDSTLDYKDALAITGKSPLVRQYPMVPGIDFAGEVIERASDDYMDGMWAKNTGADWANLRV